MNRERLLTVLEIYGSHEHVWPAQERAALNRLLEDDPEARAAFQKARELDLQLAAFQPPLPDLSEAIMRSVPIGTLERVTVWLLPGGGASLLRPALLGTLPFFFGLAVGFSSPPDTDLFSAGGWELEEQRLLMPLDGESWYE